MRKFLLAGVISFGVFLAVAASAQTPLQVALDAATPATQPTTQTTVVQVQVDPKPDEQASIFGTTGLGKILRGEKKLTPEEAINLQFWLGMAQDLIVTAIGFLPRLFVAIVLFIVFWLIYRAVRRVVLGSMNKAHVDESIRDMLGHLIKWSILGFGLVIACNQIGVQIAALLTGVSIIGLAIGFAAQESLSNFIAGVVIFWDRPFRVGDWITCDDTFGQVQRVTFRSTRILNTDGEVVLWPNTHMLSNMVKNHTTNPINRVNIPIGIAYKESIDTARAALLGAIAGDERILKEPGPEVVVDNCAASSVDLLLRFWISDEKIERKITYEYKEKAKKALDAAGIEIPFPHMQLMLEQTPALAALVGQGNGAGRANVKA